jgi:hypothetical protein
VSVHPIYRRNIMFYRKTGRSFLAFPISGALDLSGCVGNGIAFILLEHAYETGLPCLRTNQSETSRFCYTHEQAGADEDGASEQPNGDAKERLSWL